MSRAGAGGARARRRPRLDRREERLPARPRRRVAAFGRPQCAGRHRRAHGFALYHRRPDWTTRLRNSGASLADGTGLGRRARGALLGDPPRRAGAGGSPGRVGAETGRAVERAVRRQQHLGQRGRARKALGQGQRPLRGQRRQLAGARRGYGTLLARLAEDAADRLRRRRCRGSTIAAGGSRRDAPAAGRARRGSSSRCRHRRSPASTSPSIPPLPDKLAAASGLPLGLADKLFLALHRRMADLDDEGDIFLVGSTTRRETMSYQVRPVRAAAHPVLFRRRVRRPARSATASRRWRPSPPTSWRRCLATTSARQLTPARRLVLARRPVRARLLFLRAARPCRRSRARSPSRSTTALFFAGEACSPNFFSTAHGAYETGTRRRRGSAREPRALGEARALVDGEDADAGRVDAHGADRALRDLDPVREIERHAEGVDQDGADHIAVADRRPRSSGWRSPISISASTARRCTWRMLSPPGIRARLRWVRHACQRGSARIASKVAPVHSPKSSSIRSSRNSIGRPRRAATISALSRVRCSGLA